MKVLWFVNNPSNFKKQKGGCNGCGWISSMENAVSRCKGIDLKVSFILDDKNFCIRQGNVTYYPIKPKKENLLGLLYNTINFDTTFSIDQYDYYLCQMQKIITDSKPDIIHVFGSENIFGLVSQVTNIPIVLHIQGILEPYLNAFLPPFESWSSYIFKNKSILSMYKNWRDKYHMLRGVKREEFILQNIFNYIGRTEWDYRITKLLNPKANYYYGGEILRQSFYTNESRSIPSKLKIISTISAPIYKGFDLILKTVNLLLAKGNIDFVWHIYGNVNYKVCKHMSKYIILKGVVDAEQLKDDILTATAYVHPSYIDNSPNSVCEAQILGCPVIATNVGGVSSLIVNSETGFLIPANDPYQLAYLLLLLYNDKQLNIDMGIKAKEIARKRHSVNDIVNSILNTYNLILEKKC